jgi:hypothetical protein
VHAKKTQEDDIQCDALAYYYDNRAEVEADIAANREDVVRSTAPILS